MADLHLPDTNLSRADRYLALEPELAALVQQENDLVAAMANFSAAVHQTFGWHWVGFYRVVGNELVLGPFQGPVACTRIAKGKGVCGTAWAEGRTMLVPDVEHFPGHIACSALSRSEVVVPCRSAQGDIRAVLDIDSSLVADFDEADVRALERLCDLLRPLW